MATHPLIMPTGQELILFAASNGDDSGQIGRWTEASLTKLLTATSLTTPMNGFLGYISALLEGAGLDPSALSDAYDPGMFDSPYALAYRAHRHACCYHLYLRDATNAGTVPNEQGNNVRTAYYQERVNWHFDQAGLALMALGFTENRFWHNPNAMVSARNVSRMDVPHNNLTPFKRIEDGNCIEC